MSDDEWCTLFETDAETALATKICARILLRDVETQSELHGIIQEEATAAFTTAVEAERARIVAIIDGYAQPDRFKPSEAWRDDMTVADVYGTGVADACVWIVNEIARGESAADPRLLAEELDEGRVVQTLPARKDTP